MTDMEPKFSSPELNAPRPEQTPAPGQSHEQLPEAPRQTPEYGEVTPERSQEQAQQAAPAAPQPTPISLPTPVPVADDNQAATQSDDDLPAVAADEDLIEKEWVDKAKKIIAETKDDPHQREKEVGRLQADYLKKRYGKELGASS
jgi:hypothetical protein